jgi:transcriptional regulator with XRE-family HTH domain
MSFGETLRTIRERAGLSRQELARQAGVPLRSLEAWEVNRFLPRLDAVLQLAKALGTDVNTLAEWPGSVAMKTRKRATE